MDNKLTLEEARKQYRNKNKKCKYCEFSTYVKELDDECWDPVSGCYLFTKDVLYCKVKEEIVKEEVCEFYQTKE